MFVILIKGGMSKMNNKIEKAVLHEFYRELDDLVGEEAMLNIYQQYKGMQISIPTHLYDRKLASQKIITEYNGCNKQALARKYGYSQKWVQRVLHCH